MARIVHIQNSHKTVLTQLKPGDTAIRTRDPYRLEFGCVEGAHQVERQNTNRSGVTEDCNLAAGVFRDDFVKLLPPAVEQLAVAFSAGQYVIKITTQQR